MEREITPITSMTKQEIDEAMCRFALEIRRKDGKQYPPNTIHHICCGVMRYLRTQGKPEIDFFKDSSFSHFRAVLDSEMNQLQGQGVGSKRRQAEPITQEEEEVLWKKGMLGQNTGRALVDTMLYMCGTYFALRSGQEHRSTEIFPIPDRAFLKNRVKKLSSDILKMYLRTTQAPSRLVTICGRGRKSFLSHSLVPWLPGRSFRLI